MTRLSGFLISTLAVLVFGLTVAKADTKTPVVLELFTSQGCSSCPPADRLLGDLADEDGVIALSFHVDYWDYIGWKDTFASKVTTARQHAYARSLGERHVYTPQLVIGGKDHVVGSSRHAIRQAIREAGKRAGSQAHLKLTSSDGLLKLDIPDMDSQPCEAWLFTFDRRHEVAVQRGENSGHKLAYSNVVREVHLLGRWEGGKQSFTVRQDKLSTEDRDGYVVIVQAKGQGPVLAAVQHWLKK